MEEARVVVRTCSVRLTEGGLVAADLTISDGGAAVNYMVYLSEKSMVLLFGSPNQSRAELAAQQGASRWLRPLRRACRCHREVARGDKPPVNAGAPRRPITPEAEYIFPRFKYISRLQGTLNIVIWEYYRTC